jgi:carbon storage regulator
MLVLSRKVEQGLVVGDNIVVTVLSIDGDRVKLGIVAPRSVSVLRDELYHQLKAANAAAATSGRPTERIRDALRNGARLNSAA